MASTQARKVKVNSTPKVKETRKSVLKKQKILEAAAKIFSRKGYAEATLAEIGKEAGTHAGSLYYYFDSKEALVEEVLNIGTHGVSRLVTKAVAELPPETSHIERIRVAFRIHVTQMLLKDDFIVAYWKIVDQVPPEIRERHLNAPREYGRFLQSLIDDAQQAGEIRVDINGHILRLMMVGSSIYALDWFNPRGELSSVEIADTLIDMFFNGAVPRIPADD